MNRLLRMSLAAVGAVAAFVGVEASAWALQVAVTTAEQEAATGRFVHFRVWVSNDTAGAVRDVTVGMDVPTGATLSSVSRIIFGRAVGDGWTCSSPTCANGARVTVTLGQIAPGQSRLIEMPLRATAASGTLTLQADARVGAGAAVSASATATVQGAPSGSLAVFARPGDMGSPVRVDVTFGALRSLSMAQLVLDLPAGATGIVAGNGTVVGTEVRWMLGALPAGAGGRRRVTFDPPATAAAADLLKLSARLEGNGAPAAIAEDVVPVGGRGGLVLDVQETSHQPVPGGLTLHRIVVANEGTGDQLDVVLDVFAGQRARLPQTTEVHFPGVSPPALCPNANALVDCASQEMMTWPIGTLRAGERRVLELPLRLEDAVSAPVGLVSEHHFVATALGAQVPVTVRRASTVVGARDWGVSVGADQQTVSPGGATTFEILVGNVGSTGGAPVDVVATVPAGFAVTDAPGGTVVGGQVEWPVPTLGVGASARFQVTVSASASVAAGRVLPVEVELRDASDAVLARAGDAVAVRSADPLRLHVDFDADRPRITSARDFVLNAGYVRHKIVVSNAGAAPIANVEVWMVTPEDSALANTQSASPPATCPNNNGFVDCGVTEWMSWSIPSLPPAENRVIDVPSTVAFSRPGAVLPYQFELRVGDRFRAGTRRSGVVEVPSVHAAVAFERRQVPASSEVTIEVAAGNNDGNGITGGSALDPASLALELPAGFQFVRASDGGTYDAAQRRVQWSLGRLGPRTTASRRAVVRAPMAPAGQVFSGVVRLLGSGGPVFSASDSVTIVDAVPLDVRVARVHGLLSINQDSDYLVTVGNPTTSAVADVTLRLSPSRVGTLRRVDYANPPADACINVDSLLSCSWLESASWSLGTLAPGDSRTVEIPMAPRNNSASGIDEPTFSVEATGLPGPIERAVLTPTFVAATSPTPLVLGLEVEDRFVEPGDPGLVFVKLGNPGAATSDLLLQVDLPAGVLLTEASAGATVDGRRVSWSVAPMPPRQSRQWWLRYRVDSALPDGRVLPLRAELRRTSGANAGVVRALSESLLTVRSGADLSLRAAVRRGPFRSADLFVDAVVVNTGGSDAPEVVLELKVPEHLRLRTDVEHSRTTGQAFGAQATYPNFDGLATAIHEELIRLPLARLAPGTSRLVTFPVTLNFGAGEGDLLESMVQVRSAGRVVRGRNIFTPVRQTPLIDLRASFLTAHAPAGGQAVLEVSVGNSSGAATPAMYAEVFFDPDLTPLIGTGVSGQRLVFPIGSVALAQWYRERITFGVDASAGRAVRSVWVRLLDPVDGAVLAATGAALEIDSAARPSLAAEARVVGSTTFAVNATVSYGGAVPRSDAGLKVLVPEGTESSAAGGGACDNRDGRLACNSREWIYWPREALGPGGAIARRVESSAAFLVPGRLLSAVVLYNDSNDPRRESRVVTTVGVAERAPPILPNQDTDNDTFSDVVELLNGLNPFDPADGVDADDDRMPDVWELRFGLDPMDAADAMGDLDNDGLTNRQEFEAGSDPTRAADRDGDGFPDGYEASNGFNPDDPNDPAPTSDTDGDGLTNAQERVLGTSPFVSDSDADGLPDGWEVQNGLDPTTDDADLDPDMDDLTNRVEFDFGLDPQVPDPRPVAVIDAPPRALVSSDLEANLFVVRSVSTNVTPASETILWSSDATLLPTVQVDRVLAAAPVTAGEVFIELQVVGPYGRTDTASRTVDIVTMADISPAVVSSTILEECVPGGPALVAELDGCASGGDNYRWGQESGPEVALPEDGECRGRVTALTPGVVVIVFQANDSMGTAVSTSIEVPPCPTDRLDGGVDGGDTADGAAPPEDCGCTTAGERGLAAPPVAAFALVGLLALARRRRRTY